MERPAAALVVALVLALAPAAAAGGWTTVVGSGLDNSVDPALLRTSAGSELVAFDSHGAGTISLARDGGAPRVLVANDPAAGEPQLVQQRPGGLIRLYFPNAQGVAYLTSSDDGVSWTGPLQTRSTDVGDVQAAAVRADGTPLFSQDGTGFLNVFQGLNGELLVNVFPSCCAYAESLAVDSTGLAQVALWSNATGQPGYVYQALDPSLGIAKTWALTGSAQTVANDSRVPLVADGAGDTFAAYASGYPTANVLWLQRFRAASEDGRPVRLWRGPLGRTALAVEPDGRLWALWVADGAVRAARSRSAGAHFGAQVNVPLRSGATAYQLEALARAGSVTAYVNTGSGLVASTRVLPGLAVSLKRSGRVWTAIVTDDGAGVGGAAIAGGGRSRRTNAKGKVSLAGLPHHLFMRVRKNGYTPTGFRVP